MLIRYFKIIFFSILLTLVTDKLPHISNEVTIESNEEVIPEDIQKLRKQNVYTEEEFNKLKKYSESNLKKLSDVPDNEQLSLLFITNTLHRVAIVWFLFFLFLSTKIQEYVLALIYPLMYYYFGIFIDMQIVIILGIALTFFTIKNLQNITTSNSANNDI